MAAVASRQRWDRDCWQWVYDVKPEEIMSHHIDIAYGVLRPSCVGGKSKHRRNCTNNPNCLVRLGESNWLDGFREEEWYGIDDPTEEVREKGSCIGLKNLGATCYINTFLQVWYHSLKIRQAVYRWTPRDQPWGENPGAGFDWSSLSDKDLEPTCVCGHLQLLFALLQFSERSYIDPSSFVQSLGLDAAQQQDAQEFGKLFLSLLEEQFSRQSDPATSVVIPRQFRGQYTYVTRCLSCGTMSKRPASFYELDLSIKMQKTLDGCIMEFLKEEKLENSNQYHCDHCMKKCDAVRQIQITKVPPILNIQLLRFVYCMQTGNKQKLNTFISFPEVLDLAPYVNLNGYDEKQELIYELKAVLIHRGPSANSGHYVAHIYDPADSNWYKFNDEEVQQIKGKTLKLGLEEDPLDPTKGKKTKAAKGSHSSKNAYMLVYHRRQGTEDAPVTEPTWESLPRYLQEMVTRDNGRLQTWMEELVEMRRNNVETGRQRHDQVVDTYSKLPAQEDPFYDFIQTSWIKEWLDPAHKVSEIPKPDNTEMLCSHERLDPGKIHLAKRIKKVTAEDIYQTFGGGPRLTQKSLCRACVRSQASSMRLQSSLQEDSKQITLGLKSKVEGLEDYWVGKRSLKCWRRLAQALAEDTTSEAEVNGTSQSQDSESRDGETSEDLASFNSEIQCCHGNLSTDTSKRRGVSPAVWQRLRKYFPACPEFPGASLPCELCQGLDSVKQEENDLRCFKANMFKESLPFIYIPRKRPIVHSKDWAELIVVNHSFILALQNFMRHPTTSPPPTKIDNGSLLCEHYGLLVEPWNSNDPNSAKVEFLKKWFNCDQLVSWYGILREFLYNRFSCVPLVFSCVQFLAHLSHVAGFFLLWCPEWEYLKDRFTVDYSIRLFQNTDDSSSSQRYFTQPEVCDECFRVIQESLQSVRYLYNGAKLYVRKLTQDDIEAEAMRESRLDADPDYHEHTVKKAKMEEVLLDGQRRSSRHRRVRGEKEVIASSSNTLKELKIKVMHSFSVPPFDQTLVLDGRVLGPDNATLAMLQVEPESIICLKVDTRVTEDALKLQNMLTTDDGNHTPEAGFKGTGLHS